MFTYSYKRAKKPLRQLGRVQRAGNVAANPFHGREIGVLRDIFPDFQRPKAGILRNVRTGPEIQRKEKEV